MSKQSSRICPRCGHESHTGDTFCGNCGLSLTGSSVNDETIGVQHARIAPRAVFFIIVVGALILGILLGKEVLANSSNMGNTTPEGTSTRTPTPTPVTKTHSLTLMATQGLPGLDTGIQLTAGDRLIIKASGEARFGPPTGNSITCYGGPTTPDGVNSVNGSACRYADSLAVYPSAPVGTLLASIGQVGTTSSTGWFVIGSNYSVTIWISGELFLIYNDESHYYYDNSGSYQVTITVMRG